MTKKGKHSLAQSMDVHSLHNGAMYHSIDILFQECSWNN